MRTGSIILTVILAASGVAVAASAPPALMQDQQPTFRAAVNRVAVAVTVRSRKGGKLVSSLKAEDFQLFDSGQARPITDFRTEVTPVSLGLLVDFSGSMDVASKRRAARDNAFHLLSWLRPGIDQAGLYVFDKTLREVQRLAPAPGDILAELDSINRPFGATSLFDAVAETGRVLADQGGARRAVVALTDGSDNASRLTSTEVSTIASGIDVPVYILIVVSPLDRVGQTTINEEDLQKQMTGPLADLAHWTGGEIFAGLGPASSSVAAQQIVGELRQQYLIAFEADSRPGWHPIELRTRDKDLVVRTRSGYVVRNQPAVQ